MKIAWVAPSLQVLRWFSSCAAVFPESFPALLVYRGAAVCSHTSRMLSCSFGTRSVLLGARIGSPTLQNKPPHPRRICGCPTPLSCSTEVELLFPVSAATPAPSSASQFPLAESERGRTTRAGGGAPCCSPPGCRSFTVGRSSRGCVVTAWLDGLLAGP